MKPILLATAALGLAISAAHADCSYHKTVSAGQIDQTTVASVDVAKSQPAVAGEDAETAPVEADAQ
jgi:hypothetical protein